MSGSSSNEEEATISFPSIAFVAVLGYIIYRYFIAKGSSTGNSSSGSSSSRNGLRFTAAQVDQISQMFPQLNRRDIMWDLHRNRGSVQATTERALMGRGLDPAPPSFQPPLPATSVTSTTPLNATAATRTTNPGPDLITRYNLQSRVASVKGKEKEEQEEVQPPAGWASTKEQRQVMLQRRRDEMILAARKKMQERDSGAAQVPSI